MIKACGNNQFAQLCEKSNGQRNIYKLNIDPSSLLSYSVCYHHSILITKNGQPHKIGENAGFNRPYLSDSLGNQYTLQSAVCGQLYTLYLTNPLNSSDIPRLVYEYQSKNNNKPYFLDIGRREPKALFGGSQNSAAIDTNGSIIIINEFVFKSSTSTIQIIDLPDNEKAIYVACCDKFLIALSSTGRVFESKLTKNRFSPFFEIEELRGKTITGISGIYKHCLAVSDDGRVFARGGNTFGQIDSDETNKFEEIVLLKNKNIDEVYAGYAHSLFKTFDGKVFACGNNSSGQLFLQKYSSEEVFYRPMETKITNGASFCICGNALSVFFIDCNPPINGPNRATEKVKKDGISLDSKSQQLIAKDRIIDELNEKIKDKDKEIAELRKQLYSVNSENKKLLTDQQKLDKLIKKYKTLKSEYDEQHEEIKKLKENEKKQLQKHDSLEQIENLSLFEENSRLSSSNLNLSSSILLDTKELDIIGVDDIDQMVKLKKLGEGGTSTVFEVKRFKIFALKVINEKFCHINKPDEDYADGSICQGETNIDIKKMQKFLQEYEILNRINNPNIIKAFGFCFGDKTHQSSILLEFCPSNLKEKLRTLNDEERIRIIIEICSAMKYVHENNIIHCDLKPENILLDENNNVKLSDFGLCKLIDIDCNTLTQTVPQGTFHYMAPELLEEGSKIDEKVDVYSFGIVMFMIITKAENPPYWKSEEKKKMLLRKLPDFSKKLVNECWSYDPKDRPSFKNILERIMSNEDYILNE